MREKNDNSTKFEFLLKLNDNIVCQRYFNVKSYNPKTLKSLELHQEVLDVVNELKETLKYKTSDYMVENYHMFLDGNDLEKDNTLNDYFTISIRKDDKNVITRYFEGSISPTHCQEKTQQQTI